MPTLSWKNFFTQFKESYFGTHRVNRIAGPTQKISWIKAFFVTTFGGFYTDEVTNAQRRIYLTEGARGYDLNALVNDAISKKGYAFERYKNYIHEHQTNQTLLEQLALSIYEENLNLQSGDETEVRLELQNYLHQRAVNELYPLKHIALYYKHPNTNYHAVVESCPHVKNLAPPTYSSVTGWLRFLHPCNWLDCIAGSIFEASGRIWAFGVNQLFCSYKNSIPAHLLKLPALFCFGIKMLTYGLALTTNSCEGLGEMKNFCQSSQVDVLQQPVWVPSVKRRRIPKPKALRKSKSTHEIIAMMDNPPEGALTTTTSPRKKSRRYMSTKPSMDSRKELKQYHSSFHSITHQSSGNTPQPAGNQNRSSPEYKHSYAKKHSIDLRRVVSIKNLNRKASMLNLHQVAANQNLQRVILDADVTTLKEAPAVLPAGSTVMPAAEAIHIKVVQAWS